MVILCHHFRDARCLVSCKPHKHILSVPVPVLGTECNTIWPKIMIILPTKEMRCHKNSKAVWSKIRLQWPCQFTFWALMGSAKVAHSLHHLSFCYCSRGGRCHCSHLLCWGTPPVYSLQHDLMIMSSHVPFLSVNILSFPQLFHYVFKCWSV